MSDSLLETLVFLSATAVFSVTVAGTVYTILIVVLTVLFCTSMFLKTFSDTVLKNECCACLLFCFESL